MSKIVQFIVTHDSVFRSVKQETSLLAERRTDNEGNSLFEQLVFDEEYDIKFREYFFNAQAEIIPAFLAYMKEIPEEAEFFEHQDFSKHRDFMVTLVMPAGFTSQLTISMDSLLHDYFMNYIVCRWLETKSTDDAAIYGANTSRLRDNIKGLLEKRCRSYRRLGGYF